MHPTLELTGSKSTRLNGKKIVVGVTGSIAAVETLKLCRELVRHGADVRSVMSDSAQGIITPDALHFACGRPPIFRLDGGVQHVELFSSAERADLFVISPCTANTISKIAMGIDDTPVTTCATTALGAGVPILIVPAMDLSMWNHKIVKENIGKLRKLGVAFVGPLIEEKKAKITPYQRIVAEILRAAGPRDFSKRRVLVIAGSTEESIDDIRVISNRSTGETGVAIARSLYARAAEVTLWMGRCEIPVPEWIPTVRFGTIGNLMELVSAMGKFDIIIMPAAVSDYTVRKVRGKIPSAGNGLSLKLIPTPKVIAKIRKKSSAYLVGFKLEAGVSEDELVHSAKSRMKALSLDMVVANSTKDVYRGRSRVYIIDRHENTIKVEGNKDFVADRICDRIFKDVA